jgi:hypothetical protein
MFMIFKCRINALEILTPLSGLGLLVPKRVCTAKRGGMWRKRAVGKIHQIFQIPEPVALSQMRKRTRRKILSIRWCARYAFPKGGEKEVENRLNDGVTNF